MKKITTSILLAISLMNADNVSYSDEDKFINKYIKKDAQSYKDGLLIQKKESTINTSDIIDRSAEIKEQYKDFKLSENSNNDFAKSIADNINKQSKSKDFKEQVSRHKDFILDDKAFGIKQNMGKYSSMIEDIKSSKYANVEYSNQYLASDERLILLISSSIPEATLKNYVTDLKSVGTDVVMVMQGFIGNNISKFMPTKKFAERLLIADDDKKSFYNIRIDINPKMFIKYDIQKVPAFVFVKNYNPLSEKQGANAIGIDSHNSEQAYIYYGDSKASFALEKINKKAKSNGLKLLISKMNENYFNASKKGGK